MLKIRHVNGRDRPVIVCDHCGELIEDAKKGNYQWVMGSVTEDVEMFFTHKACCRAFEAQRPLPEHHRWGAIPLSCLPVFLGNNLKLNWKQAKETAEMIASI